MIVKIPFPVEEDPHAYCPLENVALAYRTRCIKCNKPPIVYHRDHIRIFKRKRYIVHDTQNPLAPFSQISQQSHELKLI